MTSSSNDLRAIPPDSDELEITLFGPGVGESVVVHLGDGEWMVVDSCVDRATGHAVALDYLASLGVPIERAVSRVVVTHWHNDHTQGASQILNTAKQAELVCSAALRSEEFQKVLGASATGHMTGAGADEFRLLLDVLRERTEKGEKFISPKWAIANTTIYQTSRAKVFALSPSSMTFTRSLHEISSILPSKGAPKRRAVSHKANEVAVVLWIKFGRVNALLGADLEIGRGEDVGWRAIVSSEERPSGKATVFKVPHHGSPDADYPPVWKKLLVENPYAILTPFRRSDLPGEDDCRRIVERTGHAYLSAPTRAKKPVRRAPAVERIIRTVAPDLRELEGKMGYVRVRIRESSGHPTVGIFPPAEQLRRTA